MRLAARFCGRCWSPANHTFSSRGASKPEQHSSAAESFLLLVETNWLEETLAAWVTIAAVFAIRVLAVRYRLQTRASRILPRSWRPKTNHLEKRVGRLVCRIIIVPDLDRTGKKEDCDVRSPLFAECFLVEPGIIGLVRNRGFAIDSHRCAELFQHSLHRPFRYAGSRRPAMCLVEQHHCPEICRNRAWAKLADSGENQWQVVVDGKPTKILTTKGKGASYRVADSLPPGEHTVELVKRTEAFCGNTQFLGFQLSEGGRLLEPASAKHRIEIIGDSISCGYGNEGKSETEHFSPTTENAYLTYGASPARELGADCVVVAWSGRKMWPDNISPAILRPGLAAGQDVATGISRGGLPR